MKVQEVAGGVFVITLETSPNSKGDFENRFTLSLVNDLENTLFAILANPQSRAIVITGGMGNKFFSNGHNIDWLETCMASNPSEGHLFIERFYRLLAIFMSFPLPTVAAINGHAFAGGCLLAMAQDYRIMQSDRGFLCMNEVDMVPVQTPLVESKIVPGIFKHADEMMTAVLRHKISPLLLRNMFLRGTRFNGKQALEHGLVDEIASTELIPTAVAFAVKLGEKAHFRNRNTIAVLKYELARPCVRVLVPHQNDEWFESTIKSKL